MKKNKPKSFSSLRPATSKESKDISSMHARAASPMNTQPHNGLPLVDDNPNDRSDFDPSRYMNQDA